MRTVFQEEMSKFLDNLSFLGNSANESLHKAVKALNEADKELAHELFSDDLRINALTVEVEQEAYRLIALQQPVTGDLRKIFAVLMASSDFERMADHATSIARAVIRRSDDSIRIEAADNIINKMATIVGDMITDSIEAFMKQDPTSAQEVAQRDVQVDELLKQMYTEIPKIIEQNQEVVQPGIGYIGVANNLERIGDYVTNICERIVYISTGDIVELN